MSVPRRILVLHGYSQNASIFSKRLGALRKQCAKESVELVFVDGPIILEPVDLPNQSGQALGAPEAQTESTDPALIPRGWWKADADKNVRAGLDTSLAVLRDVLVQSRFDGVFGFSQGASLAALLTALLERPHLYPQFLVDGKSPHPPFLFCVAVSGFRTRGVIADDIFAEPYNTPTLHVIGKNDIIVVEERAKTLLEVATNSRVEEHEGGHFVPSKNEWRKFLVEYLKDSTAAIASPGSRATSGTATPVDEPKL